MGVVIHPGVWATLKSIPLISSSSSSVKGDLFFCLMRETGESNPKANARFIYVTRYRRGMRADWDYALSGSLYHISQVAPSYLHRRTGLGFAQKC